MAIFGTYGIVTDPRQQRALSPQEIEGYQLLNAWAMQQARYGAYGLDAMANWPRRIEKPLDERFADFKTRLAEAVEAQTKKAAPR